MASQAQTAKHKTAELSVTFKCWFLTIQTDTCLKTTKTKNKKTNCYQCILLFHTIKYNHTDMTCDSSLLGIPFNKQKQNKTKNPKPIHRNTTTGFPSEHPSQNIWSDKLWVPFLYSPTHPSSFQFPFPQQIEETHSIEFEVTSTPTPITHHHCTPSPPPPPKKGQQNCERKTG